MNIYILLFIVFFFVILGIALFSGNNVTEIEEEAKEICSNNNNLTYVANPLNCQKFYLCTSEQLELTCPKYFAFDIDTNNCRPREEVDCGDRPYYENR